MASLQTTHLDHVNVRSVPLLGEFIEGHGDAVVYFSAILREIVPGGITVNRIVIVTDAAVYKIPQTASETGIFFNSRVPLANITQVLVVETESSCVQFNGMKAATGEQTLFSLEMSDPVQQRDCMLTLCHLLPDLPILKKKKVDGRYFDAPYVEGLSPERSPSPPRTKGEEVRQRELQGYLQREGEKAVKYLLDGSALDTNSTSLPEHIRMPEQEVGEVGGGGAAVDQTPPNPQYSSSFTGPPVPPYVPVDYVFERRKQQLREHLFDHDLTNLQLRASLSLMEDEGEDAAKGAPATQQVCQAIKQTNVTPLSFGNLRVFPANFRNTTYDTKKPQAMIGKRSEDGTPSLKSYMSKRSEDDPEAQRRRHLLLQEEERKRQEKEKERLEVRSMLDNLESTMETTIMRESLRQQASHKRILARQNRNDYKLTNLREEYDRTRQRQREIERFTKERHHREREAFLRQMSNARQKMEQNSGQPTTPKKSVSVKTPTPTNLADLEETRLRKDRIIFGTALHKDFVRWIKTGGLNGTGEWTVPDSEALVKGFVQLAARMKRNGERTDLITRVNTARGAVSREMDMLKSRHPDIEVRTTSRVVCGVGVAKQRLFL